MYSTLNGEKEDPLQNQFLDCREVLGRDADGIISGSDEIVGIIAIDRFAHAFGEGIVDRQAELPMTMAQAELPSTSTHWKTMKPLVYICGNIRLGTSLQCVLVLVLLTGGGLWVEERKMQRGL